MDREPGGATATIDPAARRARLRGRPRRAPGRDRAAADSVRRGPPRRRTSARYGCATSPACGSSTTLAGRPISSLPASDRLPAGDPLPEIERGRTRRRPDPRRRPPRRLPAGPRPRAARPGARRWLSRSTGHSTERERHDAGRDRPGLLRGVRARTRRGTSRSSDGLDQAGRRPARRRRADAHFEMMDLFAAPGCASSSRLSRRTSADLRAQDDAAQGGSFGPGRLAPGRVLHGRRPLAEHVAVAVALRR